MSQHMIAFDSIFNVCGIGGQGSCTAVQSVLQEHGLCGYTEYDSTDWHFIYLTHLELDDITTRLGDLIKRFKITVDIDLQV